VWNDEQTEARLELLGGRIAIRRRLADGSVRQQTHVVPNFNDCKRCHRIGDMVTPIAAGVRQLNCPTSIRNPDERQLAAWQQLGLLRGLPSGDNLPRLSRWNDPATGTIERRARAWLESNCSHCHNPRGTAANSGLQLAAEIQNPSAFGVMKTPVAAGRGSGGLLFDIVPGQPKLSIMLYRVRSTQPGIMMPEFGRTQVDEEGAALLSEWIESMSSTEGPGGQAGLVGIIVDLKPEDLSAWAQEALAEGDAKRGAAVFLRPDLNCTKCHAIAGKGANVGPDLAKLGPQVKADYVVESILLPNKTIKEGFRAITLQTQSGLVITGVQVRDDDREVVLRDPIRGETHLAKSEIAERSEGGSLMPANLVAPIKRQEFLDLVRYLIELNNPSAAATQPQSAVP
jgi:putative heme-binding domain-containing protein